MTTLTVWVAVDRDDGSTWGAIGLTAEHALESAREHLRDVMPDEPEDAVELGVQALVAVEYTVRGDVPDDLHKSTFLFALVPLVPWRSSGHPTTSDAALEVLELALRTGLLTREPS